MLMASQTMSPVMTTSTPTAPAPASTALPALYMQATLAPYTCSTTLCTAFTGETIARFQALKQLLNQASAKLGLGITLTIDNKLADDAISIYRALATRVGGAFAMIDTPLNAQYLGNNAGPIVKSLAAYLGVPVPNIQACPTGQELTSQGCAPVCPAGTTRTVHGCQNNDTITPYDVLPASAKVYPIGSITTFSPKLGMWRIAVPIMQLGATTSVTHQEVARAATPPDGVTQTDEATFDKSVGATPFPWWGYALIGGGVLAAGGFAWHHFRRAPRTMAGRRRRR